MSLQEVVSRRVFDDATNDERRLLVYVSSEQMGTSQSPSAESLLTGALTDTNRSARVQLVGPSGAGKTSLILRVATDLATTAAEQQHQVLILRIGDPAALASADAFRKHVIDTIAVQRHQFSSVDQKLIVAAAADEVTVTGAQTDKRVTVGFAPVRYMTGLKDAYTAHKYGKSGPQLRQDLQDIVGLIRQEGYRPVVVIDDTEKWAPADGQLDEDAIAGLYHHGIRALHDLVDIDIVVATHPRFDEVPRAREVAALIGMDTIAVDELETDANDPPLAKILKRRLTQARIAADLHTLIDPGAVIQLQTLYHLNGIHNLRKTLQITHQAASDALARGDDRITASGVLKTLDATKR